MSTAHIGYPLVVTADPDREKLLALYLQDHYAGSCFGVGLARRTSRANRGTEFGGPLSEIASAIAEDQDELRGIMERVGVAPDPVKPRLAWAAEKLGRLKLNGRLTGYSPLSRVLELEGLVSGVGGKLSLWRNLLDVALGEPRLDAAQLERLAGRAESQLERLHGLRGRAATIAFGATSPQPPAG